MKVPFLSSLALAILLSLGLQPSAIARPGTFTTVAVTALPSITSFSPGYGVPGTVITLTGTDFTGATDVQVNGQAAVFTVVSATTITATVPAGATTGLLSVTTADGTGSHTTPFTVVTNSPANCWLNVPIPDVTTTDVPVYVSGEAGTLGGGATLTSVDISLFHSWDDDLEISLISPAGQTVPLSLHHGFNGHNYGNPFNCPAEVVHFTDGAPMAIGAAPPPFIGSLRPEAPLSGFNAGSPNGTWTLRIADTSRGDQGALEYVKLNFTAPPADLVVSTVATVPAGTYHNLTITGTGSALLGGPVAVEGTLLVENGGTLHTGCQPITGPGAFTLAAGASLSICDAAGITRSGSSGAVQMTGPRTFSPDATYLYTGATAQVTGNGLPTTVRSLVLSNAAGLTLSYLVTATQDLGLTGGVLNTNGWPITLGPTAMLSETATSYVTGLVRTTRDLSTTTANSFGGLGITLTPAPASTALPGLTLVQRTTGTALAMPGSTSIQRYYDVQPATNTGLNVTLTFGYADSELAGLNEADLTLLRSSTGPTGPWQTAGFTGRNAAANTVVLAGVDHFSLWTLGNVAAPLPVDLAAFTAQQQGSAAVLRWTTAQEKNNDRFEVEASTDGKTFRQIGTVAGAGSTSTSTRHDYLFNDEKLSSYGHSLVYYRLQQVDRDGSATTSPVRAVSVVSAVEAARLLAYPNPAHDAVRVLLKGSAASARLELFNALGQLVRSQVADGAEITISLTGLPAGVYVLRYGQLSQRLNVE